MSWKCPHCSETISELRYKVAVTSTEYGNAGLSENHHSGRDMNRNLMIDDYDYSEQSDNSDWDGDPDFECRECDYEVELQDLIWTDEDEDEENDDELDDEITTRQSKQTIMEETTHGIISPEFTIIEDQNSKNNPRTTIICKTCYHMFPIYKKESGYEESTDFNDCPRCGEINSSGECQELIKDGFFNKKP